MHLACEIERTEQRSRDRRSDQDRSPTPRTLACPFCADHLDEVLALCLAEGWPSFPDDPVRASRILTAPGVTKVVAVIEGEVIGFAELFTDWGDQAVLRTSPSVFTSEAVASAAGSWRNRYELRVANELTFSAQTHPLASTRRFRTFECRGFACTRSIKSVRIPPVPHPPIWSACGALALGYLQVDERSDRVSVRDG